MSEVRTIPFVKQNQSLANDRLLTRPAPRGCWRGVGLPSLTARLRCRSARIRRQRTGAIVIRRLVDPLQSAA